MKNFGPAAHDGITKVASLFQSSPFSAIVELSRQPRPTVDVKDASESRDCFLVPAGIGHLD